MAQLPQRAEINIAAIPIRGFGGMCMVVVSFIAASTIPATRWFMLAGMVTGMALGVGLIWLRRTERAGPADGGRFPLTGLSRSGTERSAPRNQTVSIHGLTPKAQFTA